MSLRLISERSARRHLQPAVAGSASHDAAAVVHLGRERILLLRYGVVHHGALPIARRVSRWSLLQRHEHRDVPTAYPERLLRPVVDDDGRVSRWAWNVEGIIPVDDALFPTEF